MPRKPRVFVPGAAYHVYCRAARGERPFAEDVVAARFVETLAATKTEHGLTILARCLMPNHDHLVLRSGLLPLWRSMRLLQGYFARAFNRRLGVLGGRGQTTELTRARELVMLIGVETSSLKVKDLAPTLARNPGLGSRLYGAAVASRREDPANASVAAKVGASVRTAVPLRADRE